ncbi:hypothetical protein [Dysgonomonas sp. 520]|uniref:hypothetical protein n=1 Tax=Dysgonomonas sp. 520 TaxID=2302931 RepID=UPI0013D52280|nr:hypothetical protein [Dysgonomonas sp. 520]NDW10142.1 hypothetical protein [Dysgonomonas sp. 520]
MGNYILKLTTVVLIIFSFFACRNTGYLDDFQFGQTIEEFEKQLGHPVNYKNFVIGNKDSIYYDEADFIYSPELDGYHDSIQLIPIADKKIANYSGIIGDEVVFRAYDGVIGGYKMTISDVDQIQKLMDIILEQHPDIQLYDDGVCRFKKYINDTTVVQLWLNETIPGKLFAILTYSTKVGKGSPALLYQNYDNKLDTLTKRVKIMRRKDGGYYVLQEK